MRLAFIVMALVFPAAARAQGAPAPAKAAIIAAARDVMTRARYATFATNGPGGQPQARIVDPALPDKDLTVFVGTNARTRKLDEIRANNRVTLLYFDAKGLEYVTLLGVAELVTDAGEKARHFKPEWAPFYKKGAAGDDFALIRVRATRVEVVSPSHKLVNDTTNWRPVGVNLP
jgi:general stress protein 26